MKNGNACKCALVRVFSYILIPTKTHVKIWSFSFSSPDHGCSAENRITGNNVLFYNCYLLGRKNLEPRPQNRISVLIRRFSQNIRQAPLYFLHGRPPRVVATHIIEIWKKSRKRFWGFWKVLRVKTDFQRFEKYGHSSSREVFSVFFLNACMTIF